ncbi:hypothetical protein [Streptomyces sp. NPDC054837]
MAQLTLARAGLATALIPRTAIDPTTAGIHTSPIEDHPIQRLLFAATRHTSTANLTITAVVTALRSAAPADWTGSIRLLPTHSEKIVGQGMNCLTERREKHS